MQGSIRSHSTTIALGALLIALAPVRAATAATFNVNSTSDAVDANPGNGTCATAGGQCTLRAAVQEANALPGADTIMLPAGTYTLTVTGQCEDAAATGDLDLTEDVTIVGSGPAATIIDGNGTDRIFDVWAALTGSHMTLRNGNPTPGTSCVSDGGAIYSAVNVTPTSVTLTDVVITGCTGRHGGGIMNDSGSTLTLTDVTVSGNTATVAGGGIENPMDTETLTNVTVSGNISGSGSGINDDGTLTLLSSTIAGNVLGGGGDRTIRNSIVANQASAACMGSGTNLAEDHNIDTGTACGFVDPSDHPSTDPVLGSLQDNGGGVPTHAIAPGSPAIDTGSGDCPPPATDERGIPRPADGNGDGTAVCDIGAFEYSPNATSTTTTVPTTTTLPGAGCPSGATFESIGCRLTALVASVRAGVPAGSVQDALAGIVSRAQADVGKSQAATKRRPRKSALGKAVNLLRKFDKRFATRAAKRASIPANVVTQLKMVADQLRTDIITLRQSL